MAEQEYYRLNLVVALSDRMTSALNRSRGAVNRMQENLDRTRRAAQGLDRQRIEPRVNLRDRATRRLTQITRGAQRLTRRTWNVTIRARDMTGRVFRRIGGALRGLTSLPAMLGMGVAVAAPVALARRAITVYGQFEQAMANVQAVSGATSEQFSRMSILAQEMGRATVFTATEAAQGLTYLAMAGFSAEESMAGLQPSLLLAQAGNLALGDAANIATNVLTGMRLEVDQFGRVVDIMAATAANANTNIRQMGDALSYAAPVASGAGMQLEETAAAIAALANAGVGGTRAGTALRSILGRISDPASTASRVLYDLGIETRSTTGEMLSFAEILSNAERAGMTSADAMRAFGQEAGPGFGILLAKGSYELRKFTEMLEGSEGAAQYAADTMTDTLFGSIRLLGSAWDGLLMKLGGEHGFGPAARRFVEDLISRFDKFEDVLEPLMPSVSVFADRLVNRLSAALEWVENLFADPEFQELDLWGKIRFVADDIGASMQEWWKGGGRDIIADIGTTAGETMIRAMIRAMGGAAQIAVTESPLLALLIGGLVGLKLAAVPKVAIVVAISIAAAPWVKRTLDWLAGQGEAVGRVTPSSVHYVDERLKEQKEAWARIEQRREITSPGEALFGGGELVQGRTPLWRRVKRFLGFTPHATGGILTRPHLGLVAEAGPEAIIPLASRMRNRAVGLWQETGERLGVPQFARGGFVGAVPVLAHATGGAMAGATTTIINNDFGGLIRQIKVEGEKDLNKTADEVGKIIAKELRLAFQNMAR